MSRVRAPVEVPEDVVERVRTLCLALPEVTVRVDGWAQSFAGAAVVTLAHGALG